MNYIIGQALGVVSTICCLVMPLWKKKWQMLVSSSIANITAALNLIFLGEYGSAIFINLLATVQVCVALWHLLKGKTAAKAEKFVFFAAYTGLSLVGFKGAIDILPIIGVMIYMFVAFQRDEQKSRVLILLNSAAFFIYYVLVGSTVVFAELFAMVSSGIGLWKYRRKA